MKKTKKVISLLICMAMLFSNFAANAVKIDGDVIDNITFDGAGSLDDLTYVQVCSYGSGKNGYAKANWTNEKTVITSENTDYELAADGTNKYIKTKSSYGAGDGLFAFFTATTPETNDEFYAIDFDFKMNYTEGGVIRFDMLPDALKPVTFFSFIVSDEYTGYVELIKGEMVDATPTLVVCDEKPEFKLGEYNNFRLELKADKYVSGKATYTYNNYRLFINDNAVCDFNNMQINNSGFTLTKFQGFGLRSGAAGSSYELDNIRFYKLTELTPASVSKLNVSAEGETEQYMDSVSDITFTASGNVEIADPENIEWYVNDAKQESNGAVFLYTPPAETGAYTVYAKYGDIQSESITVIMNGIETLNEITVTADKDTELKDGPEEIVFTAEGNIEFESPEDVKWFVNGEEQSNAGTEFKYTPAGGGSFEVKACYGEIESNTVNVNVIYYADPTEAVNTDSVTVFEAADGYPGLSSGDPKRFNTKNGTAQTEAIDGNNVIVLTDVVLDKSYIYPTKDVLLSMDMCLLAPTEEGAALSGYILYGKTASEANKFIEYEYDTENENYTLCINNSEIGSVNAGEWFKINIYLYASSNDDLAVAWSNARATVNITGNLKDPEGNAIKSAKSTFSRSVESFSSDESSASIIFRMCVQDGSAYVDNYLVTYPGSFKILSAEPETYGEGYGMKLDGKYYISFNRSIDFSAIDGNVTVKNSSGVSLTPAIYGDLSNPDTLIIDFAEEKLSETAAYTIEISESFKDVTGRRLLEKEIGFETKTDPSDEAYLSKLAFTVNDEENEIEVAGFSADIHKDTTYNVLTDSDTESVTLTAVPANLASKVEISPADGTVDLTSGSGSATVSVTSADGSKVVVHTINFSVSENKLVESVTISPKNLTVWADFAADLTVASNVLPEGAADKSLVWTSSDKNIVEVDMTGKLTLVSAGSAIIRAVAGDGSGIYDEMTVTVTPAENRAENQKLNLDPVSEPRIDIDKYVSLPENVGDAQIAMWYNDAVGVFTLTVDDSIVKDYQYFKEYYDKYNVKTTMFVPVKYYSRSDYNDSAMWTWADAQEGLSVQSHTYSHGDFTQMSTAELAADYAMGLEVLGKYVTQPTDVVAYASGAAGDIEVARQFHIAGRGVLGYPNRGDIVNYLCTNSLSGLSIAPESKVFVGNAVNSLYDKNVYVYNTNYYGGWLSTHYHNLVNTAAPFASEILAKDKYGEDATEEQLASEEFYGKDQLDYALRKYIVPAMEEGKIWSATFAEAAKYGQERDTAVLTMKESSSLAYTFEIKDEMDDGIFTQPLTVKIKVSNDWKEALATQDGSEVSAELKEIDGEKYVFVDAVPDKGDVKVVGTIGEADDVKIAVSAANGTVTAAKDGATAEDWQSIKTVNLPVGTKLSLTAIPEENASFLYWMDKNSGLILSYEEAFEFSVGTDRELSAVFVKDDEVYVIFRNINGKIVKSEPAGEAATVPENPYVYGYEFCGWYLEGKKQENLTEGAAVGTIDETVIYSAGFIAKNDIYTITYNGEEKEYKYNEKAKYTAENEKDGKAFSYWKRDEKIVSYDLTYSFYVNSDSALEAVYGEVKTDDVLLIMAAPALVNTDRIAFFAERNIPDEYSVIETGILISESENVTLENASVRAIAKSTSGKGQYTIRKTGIVTGETYYSVAYAIYRDAEGNVLHAYSNEVSYTVK